MIYINDINSSENHLSNKNKWGNLMHLSIHLHFYPLNISWDYKQFIKDLATKFVEGLLWFIFI